MIEDPIIYSDKLDKHEFRLLDLRPDGISCIAAIGVSDFHAMRDAPELHYHPGVMEFCLCLKGNLTFETEGKEYKFLPGQLFVSSPKQPHRLKNNPKGLKIYRLLFAIPRPGESILGLSVRESKWLSRSLMNLPRRVFAAPPSVKTSFNRIFDLYDNARSSPGRRARMKSAALDLLIAIVDAARRAPGKAPSAISELARRIRESPEADYLAAEMAKDCNLSISAFHAIFKRSMGLPVHAYVINSRIQKAKRLIEGTNRSIASIAEELRFKSKPHFAVTFKRILGLTPFALRQTLSENPSEVA